MTRRTHALTNAHFIFCHVVAVAVIAVAGMTSYDTIILTLVKYLQHFVVTGSISFSSSVCCSSTSSSSSSCFGFHSCWFIMKRKGQRQKEQPQRRPQVPVCHVSWTLMICIYNLCMVWMNGWIGGQWWCILQRVEESQERNQQGKEPRNKERESKEETEKDGCLVLFLPLPVCAKKHKIDFVYSFSEDSGFFYSVWYTWREVQKLAVPVHVVCVYVWSIVLMLPPVIVRT